MRAGATFRSILIPLGGVSVVMELDAHCWPGCRWVLVAQEI